MPNAENRSEIALILAQIAQEYEAAQNGLNGVAVTTRHSFISARMENMGKLHTQLQKIVGANEAMPLIAMKLEQLQEGAS